MEDTKLVFDGTVLVIGLFAWLIYIPQIKLLVKKKRSDSLSIEIVWGALFIQSMLFIQQVLRHNWPAAIAAVVMASCVVTVLFLVYHYRRWPGGKP